MVSFLVPGAVGYSDGVLQIKTGHSYLGTASAQQPGEPITAPFTGTFNMQIFQGQQFYTGANQVATGRLPDMLVTCAFILPLLPTVRECHITCTVFDCL